MGNETSATTVNWSELANKGTKVEVSSAKDVLMRLNINLPDKEKNDDNNDKSDENKEEVKQNEYNNDLEKYLDEYLDKLSDDELNALFIRFGVRPDFDKNADKKTKISALMQIASTEYWRKNWALHPLQKRLKNWLFVHEKYRNYITEIVKASGTDLANAQKLFTKFDKKLEGHTDFEENMLFKFMDENLDKNVLNEDAMKQLHADHNDNVPKLTEKLKNTKDLTEFQTLIKQYQNDINQHLKTEEENIIHIWLNLNEEMYKKYRSYLSWKWSAVY